jgi:hypothetical protein
MHQAFVVLRCESMMLIPGRTQIQAAFIIPGGKKKKKPEPQPEVERNINHVRREEDAAAAAAGIDVVEASGLTNALSALSAGSGPESPEAHPERRRKAAYAAYEEREIPRLREEYRGLKLSQIKEMIFKNVFAPRVPPGAAIMICSAAQPSLQQRTYPAFASRSGKSHRRTL